MKRLLFFAVMLLPLFVMAQESSPIDKLFAKYVEKPGFKKVEISGKLFASMRYGAVPVSQSALQKIIGINILIMEQGYYGQYKSLDFFKELDEGGFFKQNNYEVLMEVSGINNVHFFGRNAPEGKYSELLLIIGGYEKKVISIRGLIDPMEIGSITKALDVDVNRYSK